MPADLLQDTTAGQAQVRPLDSVPQEAHLPDTREVPAEAWHLAYEEAAGLPQDTKVAPQQAEFPQGVEVDRHPTSTAHFDFSDPAPKMEERASMKRPAVHPERDNPGSGNPGADNPGSGNLGSGNPA